MGQQMSIKCYRKSLVNDSVGKMANLQHLSQDWGNALSDKEFCDVKIICGDTTFDCHQLVLGVRSPVFRAMFRADMREQKSRKVNVQDLHPKVFAELLTFIYTGKTLNLERYAEELLGAAEKYQLKQLKSICVKKLCSKIDVINCLSYLVIGDIYRADELKKSSLHFISRNKGSIFKSRNWKEYLQHHPHLMAEVVETIARPRARENIKQTIVWVKEEDKQSHLLSYLECFGLLSKGLDGASNRTLVFVETKERACELHALLRRRGFSVTSIHDEDKSVKDHEESLRRFFTGLTPIMIVASVYVKGLDLPIVKRVINFDFPGDLEEYVNRIECTGFGKVGFATSFFNENNTKLVEDLYHLLKENDQDIPAWLETMKKSI